MRLSVDQGKLAVDFPDGAMDDATRQLIRDRKKSLLDCTPRTSANGSRSGRWSWRMTALFLLKRLNGWSCQTTTGPTIAATTIVWTRTR